jgi:hypothetical protein
MYGSAKQGWYKLLQLQKFIAPIDEHMKSFRDGHVNYKSTLELNAIKYCDFNKNVQKWSLEPFPIPYLSPVDGKMHRYYIDLFMEFSSGDKFLVEVKSSGETKPPKKPKKVTDKKLVYYNKAIQTYMVNTAKWKAATIYGKDRGWKFIILTEKELKM